MIRKNSPRVMEYEVYIIVIRYHKSQCLCWSDQCQINVKDKKTLQWVKKYAIVILLPL